MRAIRSWMSTMGVVLALAGCSITGQSFNPGGLDRVVIGRSTLDDVSAYLGARPDQTWQQGDTLLARWGYRGTVATDAVYFRQEAWLRFGPDGTFQRLENTINIPSNFRPRTAQQADQEAAAASSASSSATTASVPAASASGSSVATAGAKASADPSSGNPPGAAIAAAGAETAQPVAVPLSMPQPLLPPGTVVTPGVSYPLGGVSQ